MWSNFCQNFERFKIDFRQGVQKQNKTKLQVTKYDQITKAVGYVRKILSGYNSKKLILTHPSIQNRNRNPEY